MERYEATTFDFTEDKDDVLFVTSHEKIDLSMSIHCKGEGYANFSMYITQGQAEDLIGKLEKAIINLEVARRKKEINHG